MLKPNSDLGDISQEQFHIFFDKGLEGLQYVAGIMCLTYLSLVSQWRESWFGKQRQPGKRYLL